MAALVLCWAIGLPVAINRDVPAASIWLATVDLPLLIFLSIILQLARHVPPLWLMMSAVEVLLSLGLSLVGLRVREDDPEL